MVITYIFAGSLLATLVGFPPTIFFLKKIKNYDMPNERSSHSTPVPRAGGILLFLIFVSFSIPFLPNHWRLLSVVFPFALLGLIDDFFKLSAKIRLAVQIIVALGGSYILIPSSYIYLIPVFAIFVMGTVNAWNFMDGINGLSAFSCTLVGGTWWILGDLGKFHYDVILGEICVAAGVGFAIYNAFVPKVFLGDMGSYAFGAIFAGSILYSFRNPSLVIPMLLPLLPSYFDTTFTLIKRALKREKLLESHRDHVYQNLIDNGLSHLQVALLYSFFILIASLISITIFGKSDLIIFFGVLISVAVNLIYLTMPRVFKKVQS